jgi:hypothetical protein
MEMRFLLSPLWLPSAAQFLEQPHETFHLPLLLQEGGHDNGLKRPGPGDHDTGLELELGAIEGPIEDDLILF